MRVARLAAVLSLVACTEIMVPTTIVAPTTASNAVTASAALLVINELMPDPTKVTDANGEWIEVYNAGGSSVNLQNYRIESANDAGATITTSITVAAGGYVVLAANSAKNKNGGVVAAFAYGSAINLANTGDWVVLKDPTGATVDSVSYASSTAGKSWGVKDPLQSNSDVGGGNWQLATSLYNTMDAGTPKAQNDGYIPPGAATVTVTPSSASIVAGATQQFSAQAYDANGNPVTTTYTWTSSNAAVATVSASGLATGVAAGSATITATSANGTIGSATVTVQAGAATVTVTPSSASIVAGTTQQFSAQAYDAAGNPVTTTYTWTSSDAAVATVSASGLATGVAAGSATITATSANGSAGSAALTVTASGGGGGGGSELIVRVLDIGQGDANYIENGGTKIIIDGGPDQTRFGVLLDSLGLNNTTINAVILSHEHADHASGLRTLFQTSRNITINYFFENQNASTTLTMQELRDSINARVGRGQLIYRDTDDPCANGSAICTILMAGGAKLEILKPNPAGTTPNNRSAAEKLVGPDSASFTMWFAGDAEQEEIGWFLGAAGYATNPGMKVNVMKADHHGSCNGVTNAYVNTTNPDWVTASVGATNTYGHMHTQAKDLFTAHGKPWYRTDGNGTITFRSPGTVGGGYTVSVLKGVASMNGAPDATSTQTQCNPVP